MDKRWILIFVILIIGIFCLYQVVESSTTVGHAIATIDDVIVTIPTGFTNFQSHEKYISIENKNTNEKLFLIHKDKSADEAFKKRFYDLESYYDIEIKDNTTKEFKNTTVRSVYYINTTENNTEYIESFFEGCNHTYCVKTWNYETQDQAEKNIEFIIETLHIDYKRPRD